MSEMSYDDDNDHDDDAAYNTSQVSSEAQTRSLLWTASFIELIL